MNKKILIIAIATVIIIGAFFAAKNFIQDRKNENNMKTENNNSSVIPLPDPILKGEMSLEEAISKRRSIRDYKDEPLTLKEVSQLLWAAQGITDFNNNLRAAPSAGALYPLSIYVVADNVEGLNPGVYRYLTEGHNLELVKKGSVKNEIYESALKQSVIQESAFVLIIAADFGITEAKYGERAERYVFMEAGHVGQNIYLQTVALNLGTVAVGAFDDEKIKEIIGLKERESPLYLFPVGRI